MNCSLPLTTISLFGTGSAVAQLDEEIPDTRSAATPLDPRLLRCQKTTERTTLPLVTDRET